MITMKIRMNRILEWRIEHRAANKHITCEYIIFDSVYCPKYCLSIYYYLSQFVYISYSEFFNGRLRHIAVLYIGKAKHHVCVYVYATSFQVHSYLSVFSQIHYMCT